jgi:hypothetical protein
LLGLCALCGFDLNSRDEVAQVHFTGDGRSLMLLGSFRTHLWNVKTRKRLWHAGNDANWYSAVRVSGDGRRVVTASSRDHLLVWDLQQLASMAGKQP